MEGRGHEMSTEVDRSSCVHSCRVHDVNEI